MPENPLSPENETAALTRLVEGELKTIKSDMSVIKGDVLALRLGQAATDQKVEALTDTVNGFIAEQRTANARIVEMLAALTGKTVD